MAVKDRVAIVGIGETEFARNISDKSRERLWVEAAKAAADDAGVPIHEIDGLLVSSEGGIGRYDNPRGHMVLGELLGIYEKPLCMSTNVSGVSAGYSVETGRMALQAGHCKYVLCVGGFKGSEMGGTGGISQINMHYPDYEHPYGPLMASFYAAMAQRYMYEYGLSEEELASIPVAFRYNASLNPAAIYRKPITVEDVLNSKLISTPFHMLHCCMISDCAFAFLMTTEDRAKDLKQKPVYVLGSGGGQSGYWTGFIAKGGENEGYSLTRTIAKRAANDAFREAGVSRDEIDLVTVGDSFAITPLLLLEDLGFCKKGEGGAFIGKNGERIKVGGALPVNPHGGLLSCVHAGTCYQNYTEATLQLRAQAGDRQVAGARTALAHAGAGISSTHYVQVLATDS